MLKFTQALAQKLPNTNGAKVKIITVHYSNPTFFTPIMGPRPDITRICGNLGGPKRPCVAKMVYIQPK